jgi:hypothetical protein
MDCKIEQHIRIKFYVKLGKTATETLEDDECSGRPSTSIMTENVEKIRELIHDDCRQTICELLDAIGISHEFARRS